MLLRAGFLGIFCLGFSFSAGAETFESFLKTVENKLESKGLSSVILRKAVGEKPVVDEEVIRRLNKQPESTFSFEKYFSRMVSPVRVKNGLEKISRFNGEISSKEDKYGIPKEVIAALWGVETAYGKLPGDFNIINSLATLAYKSHRRDFFTNELVNAVKIVQEGHTPLEKLTGSWAGAMGQCQFMPSSFFSFAADGNGDGKKDIWNTEEDVFASTANYLKKSGWKKNRRWGQRVVLGEILPKMEISERGLSEPQTVAEWEKMGVFAHLGGWAEPKNMKREARLFMPEGPSGKVYLVYENFDVILKWNRSSYFAFSVLSLADELKKKG